MFDRRDSSGDEQAADETDDSDGEEVRVAELELDEPEEPNERPEVIEDGAQLTIRGYLEAAVYGDFEPEPSHDSEDSTSSDEEEPEPFTDSDATESDEGSEDEYEEKLNYDDEGGKAETRDAIHQDSLLAQFEQFVNYAQMFTIILMLDVDWPPIFTTTFDFLRFFYFDIDITFLFSHIDPDYKRIGDLLIQLAFPFFIGYVMVFFWQFKDDFSVAEVQAWAGQMTLKGVILSTLTYLSLGGIVAGLAIAVMRYIDETKGGDALWGGLSVLAFIWLLHMSINFFTRSYLLERSHFIKPKMIAKEMSNLKFSLCLFLLLVTYLPCCGSILLGLQPVFRQSWEEKGFREVSCYLKVLPPVDHPVSHHDAHPVLHCLSMFGMGLFTLSGFLVPFYLLSLPYALYCVIVMTRNHIIEQGWLREYFLFAEQHHEVSKHLSFLPTKVWLKVRLAQMVTKLPTKENVEDEISLLSKIEVGGLEDFQQDDGLEENANGHHPISLNMGGEGGSLGVVSEFDSAPPPGLLLNVVQLVSVGYCSTWYS
jgi:hypothetical protein